MNRFLVISLIGIIIFLSYRLLQPPFKITNDMALADSYQKKPVVNPKDDFFTSFTRYDTSTKKLIDSISENELIGFRCGDNILRTNQGAYILKNAKTSKNYRRTIQNKDFISFMRNKEYSLPPGKKILTTKICEAENKSIFLFYSIGSYDSKNVDNNTILQTIHDSTNNQAYLEIIPQSILASKKLYALAQSRAHVVCDEPIQIAKNNLLYLLCNEEFFAVSNYFIKAINLKTGDLKIINKCSNQHGREIKTTCN